MRESAAPVKHHPVVTIKNSASSTIYIDSDPNWDDQDLKINGKSLQSFDEVPFPLDEGAEAVVSVNWDGPADPNMMGVIIADRKNYDYGDARFYQLTIGQDSATGKLAVTDGGDNMLGSKALALVKYTIADQRAWSMTIKLFDG